MRCLDAIVLRHCWYHDSVNITLGVWRNRKRDQLTLTYGTNPPGLDHYNLLQTYNLLGILRLWSLRNWNRDRITLTRVIYPLGSDHYNVLQTLPYDYMSHLTTWAGPL